MLGQILGHYRIVEKIGEGGMGVVYRARDERLDRDVALKLLPAGTLANSAAVKSFREEAQALSRLNHPNIATIHDFDVQDGLNFLVMEYVQGTTLYKKISAGPLPEKEVIRLGTQLAQGLHAAHSKGVIHRDLKPSNLAVTTDRHLKILDFGLARLSVQSDPDATQTLTEVGPQAGSLPYMAPEQLQGQAADERSDIYAAGAVMYEMTTGQKLFPDKHGAGLIDAIRHRPVRPPRDLNGQISADLQDIIRKALDKDPDRRYQSARELRVDLQRLPTVPKGEEWKSSDAASPDREPLEAQLEIAHVLYMDIVEYSNFPMDQQKRLIEELQNAVRSTTEFSRAKSRKNLISLPSGDGMALVFFDNPESPCRCALELGRGLRDRSEIKLRMGIHTGLVYRTADINTNRNVAGGGINRAQRVMDCGDAGHILVSKAVADMLAEVSSWNGLLRDLGEVGVKHGARVHVFNLYTEDAGNSVVPKKLSERKRVHKSDVGKVERTRHKSGVRSKNGSGIKKANEIKRVSPLEEPHGQPRSLQRPFFTRLHGVSRRKLRIVILTVVMLAVMAFAVFRKTLATFTPSRAPEPAPRGVPPLEAGKFVAVLPFVVESDSQSLQALAEGLSQQLSANLLTLREISVTSSRAAENVDPRANIATIAGRLGANLVVRGKVAGDDHTVSVNVTVDEVPGRKHYLNQSFLGTRGDILKLNDRIYGRILEVLEINPSNEEKRATKIPTEDLEAYEFYNQGRTAYRGHPDISQLKTAIGYFQRAIEKDSRFALAYASLADANISLYRETHDRVLVDRATESAEQAQRLDSNLREGHLALGNVYRATGDTKQAIDEFKKALQISPKCDDCYRRLARTYEDAGERTYAVMFLQNAITLSPYYWANWNELGIAFLEFGEYQKALSTFRRVVDLEPENPVGHENVGVSYFELGRYQEALPEFQKAIALQSTRADIYSDLGVVLLCLKRYPEAMDQLERAFQMSPNNQIIVGNLADGYRYSKQQQKSIQTYDRAIFLANRDLEVNAKDANTLASLGLYHAKKGEASLAQYFIHAARTINSSDPQLVYDEAVVQALAKQPESALVSLRLAFERGLSPEQAMLDPEFDQIQDNPEFIKLTAQFLEKQERTN